MIARTMPRRSHLRRLPRLWPEALAMIVPLLYTLYFLAPARELPAGKAFLGFIQPDQVVYYALAREPFDAGSPVYANPYAARPDSPRIYSQFCFMLIGALWRATGWSLTTLDYTLRALLGALSMLLLVRLLRAALPGGAPVGWTCALALLGGGIAWLVALLQSLQDAIFFGAGPWSVAGFLHLFRITEGGYGEWFLNMFGNLAFTHELLFHALFIGCLLALARRRVKLALLLLALTWWSHPYTGLQLGAIVGAWLGWESLRERRAGRDFVIALVINAIGAGYYLLWLPRFPEHAAIFERMRGFSHPMLFRKLLPAYGLLLLLPVYYFSRPRMRRDLDRHPAIRLMLVWLVVSAGLVFHDRILFFMTSFQPMHFTRGYLFIPLLFSSACALRELRRAGRGLFSRPTWFKLLLAMIFLLHLPDNLLRTARLREEAIIMGSEYIVPSELLRLLARIEALPGPPLTISFLGNRHWTPSPERLVPVLTRHRAFAGHLYNAPHYHEKLAMIERLEANGWRREDLQALAAAGVDALVVNEHGRGRLSESLWPNESDSLLELNGTHVIRIRPQPTIQ